MHDPFSLALLAGVTLCLLAGVVLFWGLRRRQAVINTLPFAIKLLRNSLRDGRSLGDGIGVVAELGPRSLQAPFAECQRRYQRSLAETGSAHRATVHAFAELPDRFPAFFCQCLQILAAQSAGDPQHQAAGLSRLLALQDSLAAQTERVQRVTAARRRRVFFGLMLLLSAGVMLWGIGPVNWPGLKTLAEQRSLQLLTGGVLAAGVLWWMAWFGRILQTTDSIATLTQTPLTPDSLP